MSSSYNRNTELRNVHTKDLYNLAVILDDENYWQTLMEIIPKEINNQTFGTPEDLEKISSGTSYERKYNNDHIRLIENAIRRPGESRLYSQILFDEWGSSGRKQERPTLGVLLHLLLQSKLYRAADHVAELLNEPKPPRPSNGPAAEFEFEIDVFNDIQETVNDTRFYPNTEDLQENVNMDINKDYYTKYHKNVDKKIPTINENTEEPIMTAPPKPPPRLLKSARLLKQQQQQQQQSNQLLQQTANINNINHKTPNNEEERPQLHLQEQQYQQMDTHSNNESMSAMSSASANNMPNLSALMNTANSEIIAATTMSTSNFSEVSENVLPNLSALNNSSERISQPYDVEDDDSLNSTPSLIYSKPNIVEYHDQQHPDLNSIPIVVLSKPLNIDIKKEELKPDNDVEIHNDDLPAISALNLNGERDDVESQQQQESNNFENVPSVALNFTGHRRGSFDECAVNDDDLNIPCLVANMNFNENSSRHQLESIEEDYNGIEHEHDNEGGEVELEDDEDSIPNLSFLENRSSNNESSLTSVTNTSGDNSFEQSVNDCSSTSTDNVPFLSIVNQ